MRRHLTRDLDAFLLCRSDDRNLCKKENLSHLLESKTSKIWFYLFLLGHMADVDWPLVELRHHEDGGHRLLLGVSDDGHVLGPHLKVLQSENRL